MIFRIRAPERFLEQLLGCNILESNGALRGLDTRLIDSHQEHALHEYAHLVTLNAQTGSHGSISTVVAETLALKRQELQEDNEAWTLAVEIVILRSLGVMCSEAAFLYDQGQPDTVLETTQHLLCTEIVHLEKIAKRVVRCVGKHAAASRRRSEHGVQLGLYYASGD